MQPSLFSYDIVFSYTTIVSRDLQGKINKWKGLCLLPLYLSLLFLSVCLFVRSSRWRGVTVRGVGARKNRIMGTQNRSKRNMGREGTEEHGKQNNGVCTDNNSKQWKIDATPYSASSPSSLEPQNFVTWLVPKGIGGVWMFLVQASIEISLTRSPVSVSLFCLCPQFSQTGENGRKGKKKQRLFQRERFSSLSSSSHLLCLILSLIIP